MINREILRTKVVQTLYSYHKGNTITHAMAEKELFHSIERTYDLYYQLLQLSVELTNHAASRIENKRNKLRPTDEDLHPNTRFIDNTFIKQLSENVQFDEYLSKNKLSWVNYPEIIKSLFEDIETSDFYREYMESDKVGYEEDKNIWKKIFKKIILESEELDNAVEEQSIYWVDDVEIVLSFVVKTIKRFEQENGARQPLLAMFKDDEDAEFARKLLVGTLKNGPEYRELIDKNTRNWDLDRIAFMDILIMEVALSEIMDFPTIPVNVTLNEYIEIAKKYSTVKSGTFINGVLDNIIGQLKTENKLVKVKTFTDRK
jgi:N utilization substance protein B